MQSATAFGRIPRHVYIDKNRQGDQDFDKFMHTVHSTQSETNLNDGSQGERSPILVRGPLERPMALSDQVYSTLRTQLREGLLRPGQRLQEVALALELGVSRTPVREALARLASEGLVSADGRSFVFQGLTPGDVDDIYQLRFLLEPEAMRQAAVADDAPARERIEAALADSVAAHAAGDAEGFMAANARFHAAWLSLVSNRRMVRAIELYSDHVRYLRALTLADARVRSVVLRGMKRISAAVATGDGSAAARAMLAHLRKAKESLRLAVGLEPGGGRT